MIDTGAIDQVSVVVRQHAAEADHAARFPVEALDEMRATGLLGLLVPPAFGGAGGTTTDLVEATIRLGREDTTAALVFAMHCQQVAALVRFGSPELRRHTLPATARGELYLASVTTEPNSRDGLLASHSPSEEDDGLLRIAREAPMVTGGDHADAFLVTMQAPRADSPAVVDLVYAERSQLKVEVTGGWSPLGMRATESVPMRLEGHVPGWQVVGDHGQFRTIAATVFAPLAHIGWAAAWLGAAAGACSRLVGHVRSSDGRRRFDTSSELFLSRLARARGKLETVNALLRQTVALFDDERADLASPRAQILINVLKVEASESCLHVVDDLVELAGLQLGYLTDSPLGLERTLRDLRSASLNYRNDRLLLANGSLALMDSGVSLA